MLKLFAIAALFAGAQADASTLKGEVCSNVARAQCWLIDSHGTYHNKSHWGYSFASEYVYKTDAPKYVNWNLTYDTGLTNPTCQVEIPADKQTADKRCAFCAAACYRADKPASVSRQQWAQAMNTLEIGNSCRTETCFNTMLNAAKAYVPGLASNTLAISYSGVEGAKPNISIMKPGTVESRRLSDLHRRLSENAQYAYPAYAYMYAPPSAYPSRFGGRYGRSMKFQSMKGVSHMYTHDDSADEVIVEVFMKPQEEVTEENTHNAKSATLWISKSLSRRLAERTQWGKQSFNMNSISGCIQESIGTEQMPEGIRVDHVSDVDAVVYLESEDPELNAEAFEGLMKDFAIDEIELTWNGQDSQYGPDDIGLIKFRNSNSK